MKYNVSETSDNFVLSRQSWPIWAIKRTWILNLTFILSC